MAKPSEPRRLPLLNRVQVLWLLLAAAASVVPLLPHLPYWLSGMAILILGWRTLLWWQSRRLPAGWIVILLAIGGVAGVYFGFRNLFGREPGVALLVLLLVLKLMESKTRRDALSAIFLGYFLQLALFFDSQSPTVAALTAAALVVITTALMILDHDRQPWRAAMRRSGLMLAQALPFMLLLFVLFPRVQAPLWGMPSDAYSGLTGLSDTMTPGSISELSLSGAIAFRVRFEGAAPPPQQLYWRGPVLTRFDGRTWTQGLPRYARDLPYEGAGTAADYHVTLEPHNKAWLFALDLPGAIPERGFVTDDFQLVSRAPIRQRLRYAMRSHPDLVAGADESEARRQSALQLPRDVNPRSRALAEAWRRETADPQGLTLRALAHFRREAFVYTLSPPLLGRNAIDDFLFDTRRGFCEHYAAAFVFLMRAAGVPARVVTGYQGGELNPVDGYLVVRQSDAHAWAEVWVEGKGWVRVDPTGAIAPSRIERGIASALPAGDPLPLLVRADLDWLRALRFRWEALGNAWDQWVLGYNPERQRELLSRLGMRNPDWRTMSAWLSVTSGAVMLLLVAWSLRRHLARDPVQRAWQRVSRKLDRAGLARRPWEGPLVYADRVAAARPRLAPQIVEIARDYAALRYGGAMQDKAGVARLRKRIRELKLQ